MADTYNEVKKLMLIKQTLISDLIVWVWRLKLRDLYWLHKTKASTTEISKP